MKLKLPFLGLLTFLFFIHTLSAQSVRLKKTVLQAFWWDYRHDNFPGSWADYLTKLAPRLKSMGIDAIWIPPSYKNQSPTWVGYGPMDHYDLGDKYQKGSPNVNTALGTKDELLRMIAVMHTNGIEVIQDIVLNHVDGAGSQQGIGGIDNHSLSLQSNNGYKNFRYVSYQTPAIDESQDDYFTRSGRWPKNYTNFYPNAQNVCCNNEINSPYFGPDISYESNGIGQSSVIPTSGFPASLGPGRPYINPTQPSDYMRTEARNWILWFKKQSGVDGFRWDAVKHFPIYVQEDLIYNLKYSLPAWAKGGQTMLNIGEWIGSKGDIDGYVNAVATGCAPTGDTNNGCPAGQGREEHTGTFDFSLRGYGSFGGLYSMIRGGGGFDVSVLPGEQQNKRYFDYGSLDTRVHRSFSFVNSHDTYRPILTANGDFTVTLSNSYSSGWNFGNELGGNGGHLDPREPRMAAAYAVTMALDGNPVIFFEDLFDIWSTGERYTHDPLSAATLPVVNDLDNLIQAHGRLNFKGGDYRVRTAETTPAEPFFPAGKGNKTDHLVFERAGKVIIGVTDVYAAVSDNSMDQEVWVNTDFPIGTVLYDYSGAHGISTTTVTDHLGNPSIHRVLVKTAPAGHSIAGAHGHGYSLWAPAPPGVTVNSVTDLYNYLSTYAPTRNGPTIQEWEMENDLGDSHCASLGQGGRLPASSFGQRVAGKVFAKGGSILQLEITPTDSQQSITAYIANRNGVILKKVAGTGILNTSFNVPADDWYVLKVRNTENTAAGQKCFVKVTYNGVAEISDPVLSDAANTGFIWTGNNGTDDWNDCANWEEGRVPSANDDIHIPEQVDLYPRLPQNFTGQILIEPGSVPLAIAMPKLHAHPREAKIKLEWEHLPALEEGKWILEKSSDGKSFVSVCGSDLVRQDCKGQYEDFDVTAGVIYYYRLKFLGHLEEESFSNIVAVQLSNADEGLNVNIRPNPVTDRLEVIISNECCASMADILDVNGRLVKSVQLNSSDQILDVSHLPKGWYMIKIKGESHSKLLKFIKI